MIIMTIITWNCNMAFRKKWPRIVSFQPDLLIIQECEQESKYKASQRIPNYNEFIWVGDNPNKGVGILSFNDYHIELVEDYNKAFRYVIPIKVTGATTFNLFAIWAMPHKNRLKGYVGQIWRALQYYKSYLSTDTILVGDWNSNAIWDTTRKIGNHAQCVALLQKHHIVSVYHELKGEMPGKELEPTLYLLKQATKPYHLDYCFVPKKMISDQTSIEVGRMADWMDVSDHMPVMVSGLRLTGYPKNLEKI